MLLYRKKSLLSLLDPRAMVQNLWVHRRLLWQFTRRNIEAQHRGSILGLAWSVLSPLLLFGVYAFVFGVVLQGRFGVMPGETRVDYAIALFLGMAVTQFVLETLTVAPLVVVQNPNYVKKVVFPLEVLPAAAVGAALFRCLISITFVLVAAAIWGPGIAVTAWWLIPLLLMMIPFALGTGWLLAALGVFVRDMAPLMQFFAVLVMFMSAVFYSFSAMPAEFSFLRYNPLLLVVETSRAVVLWRQPPVAGDLVYVAAFSAVICVGGHALFGGLKSAFSDVL